MINIIPFKDANLVEKNNYNFFQPNFLKNVEFVFTISTFFYPLLYEFTIIYSPIL